LSNSGGRVKEASASLHLHSNSVYYRLGAIRDACGADLRDPTILTVVVFARQCLDLSSIQGMPGAFGTSPADAPR
jgi:DNA-binding PucR family transcriptional regulator